MERDGFPGSLYNLLCLDFCRAGLYFPGRTSPHNYFGSGGITGRGRRRTLYRPWIHIRLGGRDRGLGLRDERGGLGPGVESGEGEGMLREMDVGGA